MLEATNKEQQLNSKLINNNTLIIKTIYKFIKKLKETKKKNINKANYSKLI